MITPYYYQTDAKNSIFDYYFTQGKNGNPLVCMPTGTGKSIVIADFLRDVFRYFPMQRVMMLTHVWKLIQQNAAKMQEVWPTAPLGIHSAGLDMRDTMMPIVFGGVQSVVKNVEAFGHRDLLLIDEAHLINMEEGRQYEIVINGLKKINPFLKVIGFTATPYRMKMGMITDGGLFTDICFDITNHYWFNRLIEEGYLSPLIGKPTHTKIDGISNLSLVGGDFNQAQAEKLVDTEEIVWNACKEFLEFGANRFKAMVFAAGIKNAEHIASTLDNMGASAVAVHSKSDKKQLPKIFEAYSKGDIWCIVGANMLTTGYDEPQIDIIGDFQPTCSPGRHVQKLGRGTRVFKGNQYNPYYKTNCLYLDFVGNVARNGPIDDPKKPRKPGESTGEPPPIKLCKPERLSRNIGKSVKEWEGGCEAYNHASLRYCCNCAEEFHFQNYVEPTAYSDSPMKVDENPILETVAIKTPVFYTKHNGKDKGNGIISPPTVKATYSLGVRPINVFLCFEHVGKPRRLAHEWWQKHSPNPPPQSCDEFLARTNELRVPKSVMVHVNLRYPEIKAYEF